MQKMHKCDDDGEDGDDFCTTVVATLVGKCKRKRTATLGSTGRERGGVTARLANSSQFDSSNWLGRRFLWKHLNKGLVDLARQFSLRHTKYITFVLLCLTQTNKPSLRLSISPKKGYVVKFSTVATEWLWGPQVPREWFWVRRSQGKYEGKFIDLEGVLHLSVSKLLLHCGGSRFHHI